MPTVKASRMSKFPIGLSADAVTRLYALACKLREQNIILKTQLDSFTLQVKHLEQRLTELEKDA